MAFFSPLEPLSIRYTWNFAECLYIIWGLIPGPVKAASESVETCRQLPDKLLCRILQKKRNICKIENDIVFNKI